MENCQNCIVFEENLEICCKICTTPSFSRKIAEGGYFIGLSIDSKNRLWFFWGSPDTIHDDTYFELFEGEFENGEQLCLMGDDFDLQRTLHDSDFTVFVDFWLSHSETPDLDEVVLTLGQEFEDSLRIIWGTDENFHIGRYGEESILVK